LGALAPGHPCRFAVRSLAASLSWLFSEARVNRIPRTRKFEVSHLSQHIPEEMAPAGLDAPCPIGALDLPSPAPVEDFVVHERSRNINRVSIAYASRPRLRPD